MMTIALTVLVVAATLATAVIILGWLSWERSQRRRFGDHDPRSLREVIQRAEAERDQNAHLGGEEKT